VEDLPRLLDACVLTGWRAIGITHPCKEAVVPLLDELDPAAEEMGAVNCVLVGEGRLKGYNVDWFGAEAALEEGGIGVGDAECVAVIGTGGVARAVIYALLNRGSRRLLLMDLVAEKAQALAAEFSGPAERRGAVLEVVGDAAAAIGDSRCGGVVNCTEVGMFGHDGVPFDPALLREGQWVMDCVYTPAETQLVSACRAAGHQCVTGDRMNILMWMTAFELETGIDMDALGIRNGEALMEAQFNSLLQAAAKL